MARKPEAQDPLAQVRSLLTPRRRGVRAERLQPGFFEDLDG